jgi:hypothetical protein
LRGAFVCSCALWKSDADSSPTCRRSARGATKHRSPLLSNGDCPACPGPSTNFTGSSAKIVGAKERHSIPSSYAMASSFLAFRRVGINWGCGRTAVRAKVYKAGHKQFLQSPLGRFRAFLAGSRPPSLSSSRSRRSASTSSNAAPRPPRYWPYCPPGSSPSFRASTRPSQSRRRVSRRRPTKKRVSGLRGDV